MNNDEFIHQMTIECLINSAQMNRFKKKQNAENEKEYRFYKKRIVHLVKQMLLSGETRNEMGKEMTNSFRVFVNLAIQYFKVVDTNDFYQKEYLDMSLNEMTVSGDLLNEEEWNKTNQLLMRLPDKSKPLDEFVQLTKSEEESIIYPQKRKINLKDSQLKNKGLCKKKNLNNNYVEIKTSEIVQEETQIASNNDEIQIETNHH